MARFNFKLGGLLKLKESIEEQKKNEFGKAAAELAKQKAKLNELYLSKEASIREFREELENHVDPMKSDVINKYLKLLNERIVQQIKQVKIAEDFLESKRMQLMEATQEKKKLEKLKEKQFEQYLIDEKREEQKLTDEIVNYQNFGRINN